MKKAHSKMTKNKTNMKSKNYNKSDLYKVKPVANQNKTENRTLIRLVLTRVCNL